MKRLFCISMLAASALLAQPTPPNNGVFQVATDPSGSCVVGSNLQFNNVLGNLWGCNGTWGKLNASGGGAVWGSITGTLSSQTDLNSALGGKVATSVTVAGHALSSNVSIACSDLSNAHGPVAPPTPRTLRT